MAQIKTKQEIEKVKKACQITDKIFSILLKQDLRKYTETELRDFILLQIKKHNVTPSFPPIVTSGGHAGNDIHPKPTIEKLTGFVIIDFGVVYKKYMSDMTRTIFIGKPNKKEREIYALVLQAQEEAAAQLAPGTKCAAADAHARKVFGEHSKYFIHTLGHGVGTRIHEAPRIFFKRTRPFVREGMILTVEPGLYVPNRYGIRIEDTYVITHKGALTLTKSPKKLILF